MLYPLKLNPIYKEKIWGGANLKTVLGKNIPSDRIGESWEISDHDEDTSTIANGPLAGKSLHDIFTGQPVELMGERLASRYPERFPVLIKFIDAKDKLSVQVHPDDEYASLHERGSYGKSEAWYIVHAEPGAFIIAGLERKMTRQEFEEALKSGKVEECVHKLPVKSGDFIYIPAGRIHAIMPGILINEIQQNSDITYRVYDWNRTDDAGKPRELHVRQSLETINFRDAKVQVGKPVAEYSDRTILVENAFFTIEKLYVRKTQGVKTTLDNSFHAYTVIRGKGEVLGSGMSLVVEKGESFLVPYSVGEYVLEPRSEDFELIRTHI
jgi:mannose-6-phosphate isomerase